MLASRRRCLDYSKFYSDVTQRWLLAWNQNKRVTYQAKATYFLLYGTDFLANKSNNNNTDFT